MFEFLRQNWQDFQFEKKKWNKLEICRKNLKAFQRKVQSNSIFAQKSDFLKSVSSYKNCILATKLVGGLIKKDVIILVAKLSVCMWKLERGCQVYKGQ